MKKINALFKYLTSFLKSEWYFEDYPLETWKNLRAEQKDCQYGAGFTNWIGFVEHGESKNFLMGMIIC